MQRTWCSIVFQINGCEDDVGSNELRKAFGTNASGFPLRSSFRASAFDAPPNSDANVISNSSYFCFVNAFCVSCDLQFFCSSVPCFILISFDLKNRVDYRRRGEKGNDIKAFGPLGRLTSAEAVDYYLSPVLKSARGCATPLIVSPNALKLRY